jgi:hypothetical protein
MDLDIDTALVISDTATNLLIWLMPIPMVWRMRLRELAVVGILMIGSIYMLLRFCRCFYDQDCRLL